MNCNCNCNMELNKLLRKKRNTKSSPASLSGDGEATATPVEVQQPIYNEPQVKISKEDDEHDGTHVNRQENCKRTIIRQSPVSVNVAF